MAIKKKKKHKLYMRVGFLNYFYLYLGYKKKKKKIDKCISR